MSSIEIFTSVVCILVGYWVVGSFLHRAEPEKSETDSGPSQTNDGARSRELVWFEVLGVSAGATQEEIHAAYKKLISQYHPDKVASLGPDLRALAEEKSKLINSAYRRATSRGSPGP